MLSTTRYCTELAFNPASYRKFLDLKRTFATDVDFAAGSISSRCHWLACSIRNPNLSERDPGFLTNTPHFHINMKIMAAVRFKSENSHIIYWIG